MLHRIGFAGGFHHKFEVLDQSGLGPALCEVLLLWFGSVGGCGEDLLYCAHVAGSQGGKVSLEVYERSIELSIPFVFSVLVL